MRFYRGIMPFKVISFDLDDTLYDNRQVIIQAEQAFIHYLSHRTQINQLDLSYWQIWKQRVQQANPLLCEDVVAWRRETLAQLLHFHQKSAVEIATIIEDCMAEFVIWRHKIELPLQSVQLLDKLAQYYPLVALTNGNVVPERIGLNQFSLVLRGGEQGRAKPHYELFHQACNYFNILPQQMLHIGDNLVTDVQGAIQAGCQAVWLNQSKQHLTSFAEARLLPTVEINLLDDVLGLMLVN